MSRIWTQCEQKFKFSSVDRSVFRVVEAQHRNSTRKLVSSDDEQAFLEEEIERVKPRVPQGIDVDLHYLLWTPFRYPPLEYGSRFGPVTEPSLWYGSLEVRSCFAEKAYYRWKFLNDSEGVFDALQVEMTLFSVRVSSKKVADLSASPFAAFESQIRNKSSYSETQPLGSKLRDFGAEAIKYISVRDSQKGANVALYSTKPFKDRAPESAETWNLLISKSSNEASFRKQDPLSPKAYRFLKSEVGV